MNIEVGPLRQQTACADCNLPVVVVTHDEDLQELLDGRKLEIVEFYADAKDASGKWNPTFKIVVRLGRKK